MRKTFKNSYQIIKQYFPLFIILFVIRIILFLFLSSKHHKSLDMVIKPYLEMLHEDYFQLSPEDLYYLSISVVLLIFIQLTTLIVMKLIKTPFKFTSLISRCSKFISSYIALIVTCGTIMTFFIDAISFFNDSLIKQILQILMFLALFIFLVMYRFAPIVSFVHNHLTQSFKVTKKYLKKHYLYSVLILIISILLYWIDDPGFVYFICILDILMITTQSLNIVIVKEPKLKLIKYALSLSIVISVSITFNIQYKEDIQNIKAQNDMIHQLKNFDEHDYIENNVVFTEIYERNSGYISLGYQIDAHHVYNGIITIFDEDFKVIERIKNDDIEHNVFTALFETTDHEYIVYGHKITQFEESKLFVIKYDAEFNREWQVSVDTNYYYTIEQTKGNIYFTDVGYIIFSYEQCVVIGDDGEIYQNLDLLFRFNTVTKTKDGNYLAYGYQYIYTMDPQFTIESMEIFNDTEYNRSYVFSEKTILQDIYENKNTQLTIIYKDNQNPLIKDLDQVFIEDIYSSNHQLYLIGTTVVTHDYRDYDVYSINHDIYIGTLDYENLVIHTIGGLRNEIVYRSLLTHENEIIILGLQTSCYEKQGFIIKLLLDELTH